MAPDKRDVLYGSLGLMILKTLEALGPLHGYRIARRIEQISGDQIQMNQGTLYPALLKLEQAGWISAQWSTAESGRRVKLFTLTKSGLKRVKQQEEDWKAAQEVVARFLEMEDDQA